MRNYWFASFLCFGSGTLKIALIACYELRMHQNVEPLFVVRCPPARLLHSLYKLATTKRSVMPVLRIFEAAPSECRMGEGRDSVVSAHGRQGFDHRVF
jgi:hypothetical protein